MAERDPCGVLLIDKPAGKTSHDVVAAVRRALRTRAVGHAGTLDPMATGLLVVLVGEATKLSQYLTSEQKRYRTGVSLGASTSSLDADGTLTVEQPIPEDLRAELALGAASPRLQAILAAELARREQIPPAVSAIHVDGERAHERVRRGEEVVLDPRAVAVHELQLLEVDAGAPRPTVTFELEVSKGYYVRSFGRDVGQALGVPAHLIALRRLRSGAFDVAEASPLHAPGPLLSMEAAAERALRRLDLTASGVRRARFGQALTAEDFAVPPPDEGVAAWFHEGRLVAIGEHGPEQHRVARGFTAPAEG